MSSIVTAAVITGVAATGGFAGSAGTAGAATTTAAATTGLSGGGGGGGGSSSGSSIVQRLESAWRYVSRALKLLKKLIQRVLPCLRSSPTEDAIRLTIIQKPVNV